LPERSGEERERVIRHRGCEDAAIQEAIERLAGRLRNQETGVARRGVDARMGIRLMIRTQRVR